MDKYFITHKNRIPLVGEDESKIAGEYLLPCSASWCPSPGTTAGCIGATNTPSIWYDAACGDFLIDQGFGTSTLIDNSFNATLSSTYSTKVNYGVKNRRAYAMKPDYYYNTLKTVENYYYHFWLVKKESSTKLFGWTFVNETCRSPNCLYRDWENLSIEYTSGNTIYINQYTSFFGATVGYLPEDIDSSLTYVGTSSGSWDVISIWTQGNSFITGRVNGVAMSLISSSTQSGYENPLFGPQPQQAATSSVDQGGGSFIFNGQSFGEYIRFRTGTSPVDAEFLRIENYLKAKWNLSF